VAAAKSSSRVPREGTLGALLYRESSSAPPVSETEWLDLVRAIAAGDQEALRALYQRSHRIVFTLIVRITNDRETAEELTLDVFHDVWRRAAAYDAAAGTVVGWLMNQARSRAIDRLRFDHRKKRAPVDSERPAAAPIASGPHEVVELREQSRILADALAVLTGDERRAIETAFFSGLSYAEVASRLEQPLGTIKTRVRSGLAKLRQALSVRQETR
jgi:RNA polymerase sigma-70 factor (ECF subfamily)